jgi:hypothetical protein
MLAAGFCQNQVIWALILQNDKARSKKRSSVEKQNAALNPRA